MQIVNAIRAGIAATKHHKNYTARAQAVIRAEIEKIFPGALVSFDNHDISVWDAQFCDYNSRWYAIWTWRNETHWSEDIENEALRREDVSDYIERVAQENALDVEFSKLELQARALETKLVAVRAAAVKLVADLPVPKSATLRTASHFWDEPTTDTQARYGSLFPKRS